MFTQKPQLWDKAGQHIPNSSRTERGLERLGVWWALYRHGPLLPASLQGPAGHEVGLQGWNGLENCQQVSALANRVTWPPHVQKPPRKCACHLSRRLAQWETRRNGVKVAGTLPQCAHPLSVPGWSGQWVRDPCSPSHPHCTEGPGLPGITLPFLTKRLSSADSLFFKVSVRVRTWYGHPNSSL